MATDPKRQGKRSRPRERGHDSNAWKAKRVLGLVSLAVLLGAWIRQRFRGSPHPVQPQTTPVSPAIASPTIPTRGHEQKDANAKWIFGLVIFLFVFGLAIHGILAGFLSSLNHQPPPTDRFRPIERAARSGPARPSYPRLQVSPPLDLQTFQAREEAELNSYGWVNQTAGVVRIPIDRAMELVLQQGLPTRSSPNTNQGGPSSYQLMQQRPEQRAREIQGEK